ncbi:hypothetical protein J6590_033972 [Homalodisca vitripennis]|nr:hypothetical protein J6590_033972 [Homalodisca vitripennis]
MGLDITEVGMLLSFLFRQEFSSKNKAESEPQEAINKLFLFLSRSLTTAVSGGSLSLSNILDKEELSDAAIHRSHRIGQQPRQNSDGKQLPRPIILRFTTYRQRQQVYASKKKLKGSGLTDLTARRMEVFRAAVAQHGPRNTWTLDGRVLWVDRGGRKGVGTRLADLASNSTGTK